MPCEAAPPEKPLARVRGEFSDVCGNFRFAHACLASDSVAACKAEKERIVGPVDGTFTSHFRASNSSKQKFVELTAIH